MSFTYKQNSQKVNREMHQLLKEVKMFYIKNGQSTEIVDRMRDIFINEYSYIREALDLSTIVAVTDKNGVITYVNNKFCEISQYSKDELLGKTHKILNSGYHSPQFFKTLWDTILAGEMWSGAVKNKRKDGSFFWVQTNIIPMINESTGEIEQFIALRTDITDGKEAEEKLRKVLINEFERTIKNLDHMVFKIKKDENENLYISLVEGKLSKRVNITVGEFNSHKISSFFGADHVDEVVKKCAETFQGTSHVMKHHYQDMVLYTTLSPIVENDKIIEIIGNTNDITLLELAQKEIQNRILQDELTNLPNTLRLTKDLHEKVTTSFEKTKAILFLDIDRFKQINDTLGFLKGNRLIVKLGKRLVQYISNKGTVYRMNGNKFAIVIEHYENVHLLAEEVQMIGKLIEKPFLIDEHELLITCSIGVTIFPLSNTDSSESIINRADTALKYCKANGKQGYAFYRNEMDHDSYGKLKLEINLRKAIKNEELVLHFQPKYMLHSNQICGVEALVRWRSPVYGFVNPDQFIPLAEETGLISQIDEWVLYHACKKNQEWITKGYSPLQMAVNISTIELKKPNFVERVKQILEATKLDPKYLELEITETSFVENVKSAVQIFHELHRIGVHLSIDDFGTGYSSLGYLKKLPIQLIKVDKSFVQEIDKNENDIEIVKAMIQLGHTLQMKVIAEGVETKKAANILRQLNCDIVQGFHYSKPVPAERFEKLLEYT